MNAGIIQGEQTRLSHILEALLVSTDVGTTNLETISSALGRRSIAAVLVVLVLPAALPVPAPVLSIAFGIPLMLVSGQLMLGKRRPWLPRSVARRPIARTDLAPFIRRALPIVRGLEQFVKPRVQWMAGDAAMIPVGFVSLILSIIIVLPIPLGHVLPGISIGIMALGLLEHDGLVVSLGLLVTLLGLVAVMFASASLLVQLRQWLSF